MLLSLALMNLPLPEPEALAASQKLLDHIIDRIRRSENGDISFAEFMDLALYAPGLGYYQVGTQKFGRAGDFITAPELSPLFSKCLARQCQQVLETYGGGDILEIGAGSGQMAADILNALSEWGSNLGAYTILELSPDLKQRQKAKIAEYCPKLLDKVQWLETLPSSKFQGLILANEVLDAMPVHIFKVENDLLFWKRVAEEQGKLIWRECPHSHTEILQLFPENRCIDPYTSEINLSLKAWITSIEKVLSAGLILLIDYGFPEREYYHPDRQMGTLMCHYRHLAHADPFLYPGLQDITAHVDFTGIASAGVDANLEVLGYTNQAQFLLNCGLLDFANLIPENDFKAMVQRNQHINVLTSPAEMGELFKVIALGKNCEIELLGFKEGDQRYRL